jgi:hypothetical protein
MGRLGTFLTLCCLIAGVGQSQAQADKTKWTRVANSSNVEVYYQLAPCNGSETLFVRFVNRNDAPVTVRWKERFDTQLETNVSGREESKELLLPVGETSVTDCEQAAPPACRIAVSQLVPHYRATIKGFRVTDVVVKKS